MCTCVISFQHPHTSTLTFQIKYAVDPSMSDQYAAYADGSLMVLLNIVQDKEMVDEGVAREVVNRIQRMRKKVMGDYLNQNKGRSLMKGRGGAFDA